MAVASPQYGAGQETDAATLNQLLSSPDSTLAFLDLYAQNPGARVPLLLLLMNLVIGFGLAVLLRWHFQRFSSTLANRQEFANIFPFIVDPLHHHHRQFWRLHWA